MSDSSKAIFRDEIVVPASAIDANGHVNNVVFIQWMQDGAIRHFDSVVGMRATKAGGFTWVVRSHQVEYLSPAFAGDCIELMTWVVNFSRVRSLRRYQFIRSSDKKLIVRGETDWVFVSIASGRPVSIPQEISGAFTLIDAPEPAGSNGCR